MLPVARIVSSVEAEELIEDDGVELDDVELALLWREVLRGGGRWRRVSG